MKTHICTDLFELKKYSVIGGNLSYAHIKKSDYAPDYDETGLLLVAGMMLENGQLDLLIINKHPFARTALLSKKSGRFIWKRYTDAAPWAFNDDVLQDILNLKID